MASFGIRSVHPSGRRSIRQLIQWFSLIVICFLFFNCLLLFQSMAIDSMDIFTGSLTERDFKSSRDAVVTTTTPRPKVQPELEFSYKEMSAAAAAKVAEYRAPRYLELSRAPCFNANVTTTRNIRSKNGTRHRVQTTNSVLRCLPSIYIVGFPKSATTDLHDHLVHHQHVISAKLKEPHFWEENRLIQKVPQKERPRSGFGVYLDNYNTLATIVDNCYLNFNVKFCKGLYKAPKGDIKNYVVDLEPFRREVTDESTKNGPHRSPLVSIDATTSYVNVAQYWQEEHLNRNRSDIYAFTPDRIRAFVPSAKIMILVREPVERLISDFYFFMMDNKTLRNAQYLHKAVTNGIKWWKDCTAKLNETQCAFGIDYSKYGLPDLGSGRFNWGDMPGQGQNGAGRLRAGIYHIYIRKWLEVFGKKNVMVIKMEEYTKMSVPYLKQQILPFLELDTMSNSMEKYVNGTLRKAPNNQSKVKKPVLDETRQLLQEFFKPANEKLAQLLGDNKFLWSEHKLNATLGNTIRQSKNDTLPR